MTSGRTGTPDHLHLIPHPRAPIDAALDPFVGNQSPDDNLRECVQVALWTALGDFHRAVQAEVGGGVVTLRGTVPSAQHRARVIAGLEALRGVRQVITVLETGHKPSSETSTMGVVGHAAAEPMLYVTRFCSLDEASVSAAIRQAIVELTETLSEAGLPAPAQLFVVYRNRQPHTMTVEIGIPADAVLLDLANGDLHAGKTPEGSFLERETVAGMDALLAAEASLSALAKAGGAHPHPYFWQGFAAGQFRPWQGHPAATLRLPVDAGSGREIPHAGH